MDAQENRKNAHEILSKAFVEAGIVDGFYCGVLIDGSDVQAFCVGHDEFEYSNIIRCQRLIGLVETCKFSLLNQMHNQNDEKAEDK